MIRALLLACLSLPALGQVAHAETTEVLARRRVRGGAYAGASLVTGRLALRASTANVDTAIDALPAAVLGLDLWPEEALGVYVGVSLGAGAELAVPDTTEKLAYNVHVVEAGGRHRWHFGERADANAAFVGLGGRLVRQDVQVQRPSLLVDSTVAGPELSAGGELTFVGGRVWLRATVRAGVPFFVREGPQDSGDPRRFLAYGGRAEVVVPLVGAFAAQLVVDHHAQDVELEGEGTRGAGVDGAKTQDRFTAFSLYVRHTL